MTKLQQSVKEITAKCHKITENVTNCDKFFKLAEILKIKVRKRTTTIIFTCFSRSKISSNLTSDRERKKKEGQEFHKLLLLSSYWYLVLPRDSRKAKWLFVFLTLKAPEKRFWGGENSAACVCVTYLGSLSVVAVWCSKFCEIKAMISTWQNSTASFCLNSSPLKACRKAAKAKLAAGGCGSEQLKCQLGAKAFKKGAKSLPTRDTTSSGIKKKTWPFLDVIKIIEPMEPILKIACLLPKGLGNFHD